MQKNKNILCISKDAVTVKKMIMQLKTKYDIKLFTTDNSIEGLTLYKENSPFLVILDADEEQALNGFSICSIIRGLNNRKDYKPVIFMIAENKKYSLSSIENSGIDYFSFKPLGDGFILQIENFLDKYFLNDMYVNEITKARNNLESLLPQSLQNNMISINYLYSPYSELSGDSLDFWLKDNVLSGYLFDCMGHDLISAQQVPEVRMSFMYAFKLCKKLNEVMEQVNKAIYDAHINDVKLVAAVAFCLDLKKEILSYTSAAMPGFFVRYKDDNVYKKIKMNNFPIGFERESNYEHWEISTKDISEIVFASDGFTELLDDNTAKAKRRDDVSAIIIKLPKVDDLKCNM